jgi:predicted nuclease with TOPRIM domain
MKVKRFGCFFSILLLLTVLANGVEASSDVTASFSSGGVAVYLTYPKEAQPNATITHGITINATVPTTLQNFTAVIKASINSSWVEIKRAEDTTGPYILPKSYNPTIPLPQDANGTLQCYIFIDTSSIDDLSFTFYTTLVSDPTFSEMRILYYEMLANYTSLQEEYITKSAEFDAKVAEYNNLLEDFIKLQEEADMNSTLYEELVLAYKEKLAEYDNLSDDFENTKSNYNSKVIEFNDLRRNYVNLNTTLNELQANYTSLETSFEELNNDYTDLEQQSNNLIDSLNISQDELNVTTFVMIIFLIAVAILISFILYLKRKGEEPYIVIRKETVSVKSDEDK